MKSFTCKEIELGFQRNSLKHGNACMVSMDEIRLSVSCVLLLLHQRTCRPHRQQTSPFPSRALVTRSSTTTRSSRLERRFCRKCVRAACVAPVTCCTCAATSRTQSAVIRADQSDVAAPPSPLTYSCSSASTCSTGACARDSS